MNPSEPNKFSVDNEMGYGGIPRKRKIPSEPDLAHANPGIYDELETLRALVGEMEGERVPCTKGTIDGSLMSTVFGIVLVMILSISIYAFTNLYRAVMKRFYST